MEKKIVELNKEVLKNDQRIINNEGLTRRCQEKLEIESARLDYEVT